uniref:Uncharacterized protein n=1 Tax=viral metagenome TaxID=1070528 RepID=A0A6M3KDF7_9ZZZZ
MWTKIKQKRYSKEYYRHNSSLIKEAANEYYQTHKPQYNENRKERRHRYRLTVFEHYVKNVE